ncbi:hypothetical protein BGX38DRAFT_1234524 [Terfezia claveryi]|nr:hypothetical protein BGX38DRAFT_1234524 [Terfezia claveryi]
MFLDSPSPSSPHTSTSLVLGCNLFLCHIHLTLLLLPCSDLVLCFPIRGLITIRKPFSAFSLRPGELLYSSRPLFAVQAS